MIKVLKKLGIEGLYFTIIKVMYDKPRNITIQNEEKLKTLLIKSGIRQGYLPCPLLFNNA
jgi:hypothetical protein